MDPRRRSSDAALHKVEELAVAVGAGHVAVDQALEMFMTTAAKGHQPTEAWSRLHAAAAEHEKLAELAFAYEHAASDRRIKLFAPEQQAYVYLRAVDFFADVFGDPDGAITYAERALAAAPASAEVFTAFEALLQRGDHVARLAKLYLDASSVEKDRERQLELLTRAADQIESRTDANELALEVFQRMLKLDPGSERARDAVLRRLLSMGRHRDAAKLLETTLTREPPPSRDEAYVAHEQLIDLYISEIKEPARALVHVEALLAIDPKHAQALQIAESLLENRALQPRAAAMLSDAYEKSGNIDGAIAMLTTELKLVRGPRRVEVQKRLAVLRQDHLNDPAGALELLAPVVAGEPGDDDLRRRFVALSLSLNQTQEAARLLSRALQTSRDPAVRARVGVDVGHVYLNAGDVKRAQATFQQVVETGHDDGAVLAATHELAELHAKAGDAKALAAALELVIKIEPEREKRQAAARRLTRLYEGELGDPTRAVHAYTALIGSPWTDEALRKLEELYTQLDSQEGLAEVLAHRAERTKDPAEARALGFRAAEMRSTRALDRGAALAAWKALFDKYGPSREIHERLIPLLEQEQQWQDLARVLEKDLELGPGEEQAPLLSRLAQLYMVRLGDTAAALSALTRALALDPSDRVARGTLEKLLASGDARLEAAEILEPIYRAEPPGPGLVRVLEVRGELGATPGQRLVALHEAVELCDTHLGNPERSLELVGRALFEAVQTDPSQIADWLARAERLATSVGDPAKHAVLLVSALGDQPLDSHELVALARAAAEALLVTGDVERSIQLYRRVLAFDPSSPEVLQRIDELLAEQGSPGDRLALYQSALEQEAAPQRRRELLHRIAMIYRRDLGDLAAAIGTWQRAVDEDARDVAAHLALVEAHVQLGDLPAAYAELARTMDYVEGERRCATLLRLAEVAVSMGDPTLGLAHYRELLDGCEPAEAVLEAAERLAEAQGDASMLRSVLERRLQSSSDPAAQAHVLEHLGDVLASAGDMDGAAASWLRGASLAEGIAADSERAKSLYERVLGVAPEHAEAAERLLEIYAAARDWQRLPQAYAVLLKVASPRALITTLLTLEEPTVQGGGLDVFVGLVDATLGLNLDPGRARQLHLAKARALGADPNRADETAAIYRSLLASAGQDFVSDAEAFDHFLSGVPASPERVEDRRWLYGFKAEHSAEPITVLLAWAAAEEHEYANRVRAVELYERVLGMDPERTDALAELARLRAAEGDAEGALEALTALRERSEGHARLTLDLNIASLLINDLGRPREALAAVGPLLEAMPTDAEALAIVNRALAFPDSRAQAAALLERVTEGSDDPAKVAQVLGALLAASADTPELHAERSRWLKRLLAIKKDDPTGSYEISLRAAEEAKTDSELWDAAERFARTLDQPGPLAEAYARVIDLELDAEAAEELGRRMVEFQEEWFDDPDKAIHLLERVLTLCPNASWAFDRLKLAFNGAGRWDELFALYDRGLAHAGSDAERVDLLREAAMAAKDFASDAERAISYLERLNQLAPRDGRVIAALERLYERGGHTRPLIELLGAELAVAKALDARQELRARMATLWLGIDEPLPAFDLVQKMLEDEADSEEAFTLLERLVALPASRDSLAPPEPGAKKSKNKRKQRHASVRERSASLLKAHYESIASTKDVVRMLEVEVETAPTDAEQVRRLQQIIQVRLDELDDAAGAFDNVAALVDLEPQQSEHRALLARLAERLGEQERRATVLTTVAEQQESLGLKARLLREAGEVHQSALEQADRAIDLYLVVLGLSEHDKPAALTAARALDGLLAAAGRLAERCTVLEQLADLEDRAEARRAALAEAARLAFENLDDSERAVRAWRACLADDAEDRDALDGLVVALDAAHRYEELIETLEARAALFGAAAAGRADLVRIGRLYADNLGDRPAAIRSWTRVRTQFGRDGESFATLVELLDVEQRFADLAALIADESAAEVDPGRRADLERQLGRVHRDRTGDVLAALRAFVAADDWNEATAVAGAVHPDKAVGKKLFATLLDLAIEAWTASGQGPDHAAAQAADWAVGELAQRLLEEGAHAAVVELYLRGSKLEFERARRRELKREAACLCADRLSDGDRAIELFREIFAEDPADATATQSVTRLAVLLEERGLHEEIVGLWEQQARCRADSGDAAGSALLWARAGELAEQRLGNVERALEAYRHGAGLGGETSLDALARIHSERGEHLRAAEVLEWLCAQSPREVLAMRALRLANAYVSAGERKRARTRLEQASATAIDAGAVRARLAELYREAKEWGPLAALLAAEAERAPDTKSRLGLLREAASLHVDQRDDPNSAVPLLSQAVELDPEDAKLRLALSDALRRAERYPEAIDILRQQIARYGSRRPKDRALVHFQLARVCLAAGKRPEALAELDAATKIDPAHPGILQALARLAFEEGQLERAERMYRGLLLVATRDDDPEAPSRAESLLDLSEIATRQGDATRAAEFVESAFEAALESDREAHALERALRQAGRNELYARALEGRLSKRLPPAEGVRALADLAAVYADQLGGLEPVRARLAERARSVHRALDGGDGQDAGAWSALGRVYDLLGDAQAEASILEKRVLAWEKSGDMPDDAEPFYRLARLRLTDEATRERGMQLLERAMDVDANAERASELLRETLNRDALAEDERAIKILERVARNRNDARALSEVLELSVALPGPQQSATREGVRLARDMGDEAAAERILRKALEKPAGDLPDDHAAWLRTELAKLCEASGRRAEALALREHAARLSPVAEQRALLLDVAKSAMSTDDLARASRILEALLEHEPADRELWEPMLEVYRRAGDTDKLVHLLEQTVPLVDSPEDRARLRLEEANILLADPAREEAAVDLLRSILEEDPSAMDTALTLSNLLEKRGKDSELAELLRTQIDTAKDRQSVPSIVSLSMRLGAVLERESRAQDALDAYRAVLDWDKQSRDAHSAVLRLAESLGDGFLVADAIEGLLATETGDSALALAKRLLELREEQGDSDAAERAAELGFSADPADREVMERLVTRYRERGDHSAVARVLRRAVESSPDDKVLLERLVEAYREAGDQAGALEIIDGLLANDPYDSALLHKRARVYEELGRDEESLADLEQAYARNSEYVADLIAALERAQARAEPPHDVALGLRLVKVLEHTGDVDAARARLTELVREYPQDKAVVGQLAELEASAENWAAASSAYRKLVALSEGSDMVVAALKLSDVCERAGRFEDARGALERAATAAPAHPELRATLRRLYEFVGARRELAQLALADAEAATDVAGRLEHLYRAGELLLGPDGDAGEAVRVLEDARKLSPESVPGIVLLARAYAAGGIADAGLTLLHQTIEAHRGKRSRALVDVYRAISEIQLAEGFLTDALEALTKAFEIDMKNHHVAMDLGRLAIESEEDEVAGRAFRTVTLLKVGEDGAPIPGAVRAEAYTQLALLARKQGDGRKAKVLAQKALSEHSEDENARALLAELEAES